MQPFKHVDAKTMADVSTNLTGSARVIAGGTDLLNAMETGIFPSSQYPTTLVNLKTIPNLNTIAVSGQTLKIGALAKIADIASSSVVQSGYSALASAASQVATPQVRNMGTLGGNLAQSVQCWYYRYPDRLGGRIVCLRKGGTTCYAVGGVNTYHSIYGGPKGCYAVYPSDTATALMALNASIVTNTRTIPIESFFDALTGTVLGSGEVITEVDVPTPASGTKQTYIKFAQRKAIDFAVVSVSTLLTMNGNTVTAARIALGGVAPTPMRSTAAESAVVGQTLNATAAAAAASAAVASATPLAYNTYKVPILKSILTQALLT